MIESIVRDFLEERGFEVYTEEQDSVEKYLVIERTKDECVDYLYTSTLTVTSYGTSMYEAAELCEEVIEAMQFIVEKDEVTDCALESDYNYTNTYTMQYRYQAVFAVSHY